MRTQRQVLGSFAMAAVFVLSLAVSRGEEAKPTPAPTPSAAFQEVVGLREAGKLTEAMAKLLEMDQAAMKQSELGAYKVQYSAIMRAVYERVKALDKEGKYSDCLDFIAAMRKLSLEESDLRNLRASAGGAQMHRATAMFEAKEYLDAIAAAEAVDREAGSWLPKMVDQLTIHAANAWTADEFAAARQLAATTATLPACFDRLTAAGETIKSLPASNKPVLLAKVQCEWARACLAGEKWSEAMASLRAIAPEDKAAVADEAKYLTEKCVGDWYKASVADMEKAGGRSDGAAAAHEKILDVLATLDAWEAPKLDERKKNAQVAWVRAALCHIRDEALLSEALDIADANRPESNPYHQMMWLAPVVRASAITKENAATLMDVWSWAKTNDRAGLLFTKAVARAGELPVDSPLFENAAFAWKAVWMLLDGAQPEKADPLIQRLYFANALEAGYADVYSLWMRHRYEDAVAAADRVLANPDSANTGRGLPTEMLLWTKVFKLRSLVALGRTTQAKALAHEIVEQWPDGNWTAQARKWLEAQEKK